MKPRVFVSSTYFDLKHVRERIERFIENYSLEPVLFESDNIFFEHNKPLDISCYNEVKLCHIMILVIGGRYGSIISGENIDEKKKIYNNEYTSITRKEYETALRMNIPTFIFIEKNVYAEYHTYNKNKDFFDAELNSEKNNKLSFAHVDDVNVFKFIASFKEVAVKTFDKIEDIENYLQSQIAGMLYLYLQELQDKKQDEKLLDSVSELKSISKRMNEMLIAVGKNVISDNTTFEDVVFNQNKILIEFYVESFMNSIDFKNDLHIKDDELNRIYELFNNTYFNKSSIEKYKNKDIFQQMDFAEEINKEVKQELININSFLILNSINSWKILETYTTKIYPFIETNIKLKEYLRQNLIQQLDLEISGLPF